MRYEELEHPEIRWIRETGYPSDLQEKRVTEEP